MKKLITLLCSCLLVAACSKPQPPALDYKSQYAPARIRTIDEAEFRKLIDNCCQIRTLKNGVTTPVVLCGDGNIQIFYTNLYRVLAAAKPKSDVGLIYGYAKIDKQQFMRVMTSYGFKDISRNAVFELIKHYSGKREPIIYYSDYYKRIYDPYHHGEFPAEVKQMLHKLQHGSSKEQAINSWYLQNDYFAILAKDYFAGNNDYSWYRAEQSSSLISKSYPYIFIINTNSKFSDNFAAKIKLKDPESFWIAQFQYMLERNVSKKKRSWDPPYDKFFTQRQIDELNRTGR